MKKLKAATIGCGRMGAVHNKNVELHAPKFWMPLSHLSALKSLHNIDLIACCDILEQNANSAKEAFGIMYSYSNYQLMLESHDLDLVTIATRTPEKINLIEAIMDKGIKALHVEKPLCNHARELKNLKKKALTSNAFISFGCLRRYLPPYQHARRLIQSAGFGVLHDINIEMGNASLMWSLVHGIDSILYYAFPAKPIAAQAWFDEVNFSEDNKYLVCNDPKVISATILFDNGLTGRLGRTSGESITLSSACSTLEIFADGKEVYLSENSEFQQYQQRRKLTDPNANDMHFKHGGTAAPLNLLQSAYNGNKKAEKALREAMTDMFEGQSLIFDFIYSHILGGKFIKCGNYPDEIGILGLTNGQPA